MKTNFFGEYECKLDEKGRLRLPSAILNQLGENNSREFVANRGFERCLYLFPKDVWTVKLNEVQGLNEYLPEVRQFKRYFYRGATEFTPDKADRILLPKILLDYAGIDKTLIITAVGEYLEVWNAEAYRDLINTEPEDISALAQKIAHLRTKGSNE
ncbi:MAG: division/cell wall cluster transcriptional repressor MraZ [Saprospiraceae bacterium]|jgi:MraZ protein|nr:division/cell wall cluster transcriptional repressor MraZ [Candidatus Opimibacter skivensis]MBL0007958.1 division/cell wall cluster transcriptional repressor MraZ [Candidatus Opimibacter skivensis]MBP6679635.1 division/cell wall cluster transcriptional repressor MraZ [Saprospiraceae bacterium]MBP8086038.1 division/cell wall cluster transcriptional repressor MraZ [Saprospiraceae bacterium]HQW25686.1 division/cell wall cluster transcriptional repressor MraZ [Saprospiraceae bacterium]